MQNKKIYMLTGLVICFIILWIGGFFRFCYTINHYPQPNREKTDAIVVLTGGRNRISEAIDLYNNHLAEKMFISGVSKYTKIQDIVNLTHVKIAFPEHVELGYKATNTIENAQEIQEWIKKNNIRSLRLITSNYHFPRSLAELEVYHLPLKIIVHPVYSEHVSSSWWLSWGTLKFIFTEYNKYILVYLRNLFNFKE